MKTTVEITESAIVINSSEVFNWLKLYDDLIEEICIVSVVIIFVIMLLTYLQYRLWASPWIDRACLLGCCILMRLIQRGPCQGFSQIGVEIYKLTRMLLSGFWRGIVSCNLVLVSSSFVLKSSYWFSSRSFSNSKSLFSKSILISTNILLFSNTVCCSCSNCALGTSVFA